ncbi:TPA: hypothetical protein QCY24_001299 [Bacillus wiedmannii]|uniref:DUF6270 domain-containing protein n=1 Tax=Bacillus TaxID=1386 RepID=UPI000BF74622|nr:DUF6270 domain-containing protein [Bacillus wiedmannii]PGC19055.1 hypothetical protein COM08_10970 [Bacillus wiedmannii]HDR7867669.1 hypothetical protein [Bacillus wiedmannii]
MNVVVTNINFNNGCIYIEGKADFILEEESCFFSIRRRESEHGIEYTENHFFSIKASGKTFSFKKNIDLLFKEASIENNLIWDLFLICNGTYIKLKTDSSSDFKAKSYYLLDNNLFKAKPYITGYKGVSIYVIRNDIKALMQDAEFNQGTLNVSFYLEQLQEVNLEEKIVSLILKKREQESLFEYYETKMLETNVNQGIFKFSMNIDQMFKDYKLSSNMIWDAFVKIQDSNGVEIEMPLLDTISNKSKFGYHTFKHNDLFRVKPYITGLDNLALFIREKEFIIESSDFKFENNTLYVEGEISSKEYNVLDFDENGTYVVFKKRYTANGEPLYFDEIAKGLNILNGKFKMDVNVSELLKKQKIRQKDVWDIFIRLMTLDGRIIDVELKPEKRLEKNLYMYEVMAGNNEWKFKPYINAKKSFSIYFLDSGKVVEESLKIAVLGSCFSRNAFNSGEYFNPGYKKNYNCNLTQFHSSIVSIMSKPIHIDMERLEGVTDKNKEFIRCDFEKDFFDKLKEAKPDYLIVDLYADAARDLIRLNDESYISASLVLRESPYFKELGAYERIGHSNNQLYFEIWKEHMEKFARKVKEILPEERIILNTGGFTYKYIDRDNKVKKFSCPEIIKRNNYFWDILNGWFVNCIPNCKVLDLKDTNYIGHYNHPFGNTFSHYQPGYYKEFMNRLNKSIMQDLQNKIHNSLERD